MSDWRSDVLRFWFALNPQQWWGPDDSLDEEIRRRFLQLWTDKRRLPPSSFLSAPLAALAAVILFDQFPRSMFRGHADQFSTDPLAIQIARAAVDRGLGDQLATKDERTFLYMPFQHSEELLDQQRSIALFTALKDDYLLGFASKHHDVIARFGRFPHRNAMLGRAPRADEEAAGEVVPW